MFPRGRLIEHACTNVECRNLRSNEFLPLVFWQILADPSRREILADLSLIPFHLTSSLQLITGGSSFIGANPMLAKSPLSVRDYYRESNQIIMIILFWNVVNTVIDCIMDYV